MLRRRPRVTRTDTLFPSATLFRAAEEAGAEHAVGRGNGRAALLGLLEQATDRAADQAPDGRAARDRDEASDRAADRRARLALLYAEGLRKGRCHDAGARALQRRAGLPADSLEEFCAERSEGRRVGKGVVSTCRFRWSLYH